MKRHAPWMQLMAVVLVAVGLVTLAAPTPAQAMDPQLALALASAAGAIALIVGYLIVANGREKERAASLEGIYTCTDQEAAGPMGCGSPMRSGPVAVAPAPEGPMAGAPMTARTGAVAILAPGCPAGQVSGPMGCGAPTGSDPIAPAPASASTAVQGL